MRTAKTGQTGRSGSSLDAHSFCWFCHVAAHMYSASIEFTQLILIQAPVNCKGQIVKRQRILIGFRVTR